MFEPDENGFKENFESAMHDIESAMKDFGEFPLSRAPVWLIC